VWAAVYTVEGREFIFAYQDQLWNYEEDAKLRGYQLGSELKRADSGARYAGYAVDITKLASNVVEEIPIVGWKVVFIAPKKSKTKRGKR
jgi:hypothetical protein